MSGVQVQCPGCGAPIEFRLGSSLVTVCESCYSVVGRGDRNVEDLGKIAFLAETDSPLEIGMRGRYRGKGFEVLGAARLGHEAGGTWVEWYLAFDGDRWGWLAEAQGKYYLTFAIPVSGNEKLPGFNELQLSSRIRLRPQDPPFLVAEKGSGRPIGARGEIPYRLVPGELYEYADLSAPGGRFGTLDYSDDPPTLYLGEEVHLDDLNLPHREQSFDHGPRQVAAVQVSCPQCGGSLELRAPDKTERVGCPYCGSMLDASQGNLKLLNAAEGGPIKIPLPIGTKGKFEGFEFIVIGYLLRGIRSEGVLYTWSEYLLYSEKLGFRWLECSDNHWNYIEPLPPGSVEVRGNDAFYEGKRFRWFQRGQATVKAVVGEFYWKVAVGEKVLTADFVRPPESLSRETAWYGENKGEINWSRGKYLPVREVEKAFDLKESLPRPGGIGPNQPFPHSGIYFYGIAFTVFVILLGIIFFATDRQNTVFERDYDLAPPRVAANPQGAPNAAAPANAEEGQIFFTPTFKLQADKNVEIAASVDSTNFWLGIDGNLVDENSGVVQGFSLPVEYYAGVEEGEAWSEGSRESSVYLSALPEGEYTMRLEVHRDNPNSSMRMHVRVRQNVPRFTHWLLAMLAVAAIPLAVGAYQIHFESRRWSDSNVIEKGSDDAE
jgi:hypothetical protein